MTVQLVLSFRTDVPALARQKLDNAQERKTRSVFDPAFDMSSLRSELRVEDRPNVAQTEGGQGEILFGGHSVPILPLISIQKAVVFVKESKPNIR